MLAVLTGIATNAQNITAGDPDAPTTAWGSAYNFAINAAASTSERLTVTGMPHGGRVGREGL